MASVAEHIDWWDAYENSSLILYHPPYTRANFHLPTSLITIWLGCDTSFFLCSLFAETKRPQQSFLLILFPILSAFHPHISLYSILNILHFIRIITELQFPYSLYLLNNTHSSINLTLGWQHICNVLKYFKTSWYGKTSDYNLTCLQTWC